MKRIHKIIAAFLAIVSVAFSVGIKEKQPVPSVNDTWRVHVSTLKANLITYNLTPLVAAVTLCAALGVLSLFFAQASAIIFFGLMALGSLFYGAPKISNNLGAASIDIDDVVSEYGAHYVDEGQNMQRVKNLIFSPNETAKFFRYLPCDSDQYKSVLAAHDEVLQGFQKGFVTKGTPTFTPHTTNLFKLMVDKSIYPDEFWPSYLGFFEQLETPEREKWPFIRWYIEVLLAPQMNKDFDLKTAWKGEYSAPTTDVAQSAYDAADGLGKIREDLIDAGRIVPETVGAAPTDATDYVDYVEEFIDGIDPLYREALDNLFVSKEKETLYRRGIAEKYNMNYLQMPNVAGIAQYPNLKVQGLLSMGTTDIMWTTTAQNRIRPTSKADFNNSFRVSARNNKEVIISWSARMGLGWEVPEIVFTNDVELSVYS